MPDAICPDTGVNLLGLDQIDTICLGIHHNCHCPGTHTLYLELNTLWPRQNGRHSPDNIFKCIFLNENAWILTRISLKCVPKGPINKIPALVQIMTWRWSGDKLLSEQMMVSLLMHICITWPQWVKLLQTHDFCWLDFNVFLNNTVVLLSDTISSLPRQPVMWKNPAWEFNITAYHLHCGISILHKKQ